MGLGHDEAAASGGGMDSKPNEAGQWLDIALGQLQDGDFLTCKGFVERALDADPLVPGADELIAVADVLLASDGRATDCHPNWYTILQFEDQSTPPGLQAIQLAYRRLALLLQPEHNPHSGADRALQLVSEAWAFLSDPEKKRLFDQELASGTLSEAPSNNPPSTCSSPPSPSETFWTMCPECFRAYEYERAHQGIYLRCQGCRKAFLATALPSSPPVVPGTDKYFCSWRVYPMGYPGCPTFDVPEGVSCVPMFPKPSQGSDAAGNGMTTRQNGKKKEMEVRYCLSEDGRRRIPVATRGPLRPPPKKVLAHRPRNRDASLPPPQVSEDGIEPNGVASAGNGSSPGDDENGLEFVVDSISIDLDATANELGKMPPL